MKLLLLSCIFIVGVSVSSALEIPACEQPLKVGPCPAATPRWYYNSAKGHCEKFTWGGCRPNDNNFLTVDDCIRSCPEKSSQSHPGQCPRQDFSSRPRIRCTIPTSGCRADHHCAADEKCCEQLCYDFQCKPAVIVPIVKPGSCPDIIFTERGTRCSRSTTCSGDSECPGDQKCCTAPGPARCKTCQSPKEVPACEQPLKVGPCHAAIPRWHYNSAKGRCEKFTWGGCSPNDNNFLTVDDCIRLCPEKSSQSHPGQCPRQDFSSRPYIRCAIPTSGCRADHHCAADEKCCEQLCYDFQCKPAVIEPIVKPGSCPDIIYTQAGTRCSRSTTCAGDSECPGDQKCCTAPGPARCKTCQNPKGY